MRRPLAENQAVSVFVNAGKDIIHNAIELVDTRNEELEYGLDSVRGVSIEKKFIDTKADMSGVNLSPYSEGSAKQGS